MSANLVKGNKNAEIASDAGILNRILSAQALPSWGYSTAVLVCTPA